MKRTLTPQAVGLVVVLLVLFFGSFLLSKSSRPSSKEPVVSQKVSLETNATVDSTSFMTIPGEREKVYPGFTLFGESGTAKTKIINMSGEVVHEWDFDAARTRLLPNCNALVVHGTKWGWSTEEWDALRPHVREYGWDGSLQWEHIVPGPAHHDVQRLANGNTLMLYRGLVPKKAKRVIEDPAKRNAKIRTDYIREVTPQGEIVWEWGVHDHLDLNSCGNEPCEPLADSIRSGRRVFDWSHSNGISIIPPNDWFESGDTRFRPGNIVLTLRNWSTVVIIDRKSDDVVWRYDEGLSGGHEGIMIEPGLPGAGNMLIFNNGRDRKASEILEIDPTTKKVVWRYENGRNFYSQAAGVAQRLPNGNTLISEDVPGNLFEVTPKGEIVWKYSAGLRTARAARIPPAHCPELQKLPLW
jgi:hypothetical protein